MGLAQAPDLSLLSALFAGDWYIWDTARVSTGDDPYLLLNDSAVEDTDEDYIDPLNSGFTVTSAPAIKCKWRYLLFLAIA